MIDVAVLRELLFFQVYGRSLVEVSVHSPVFLLSRTLAECWSSASRAPASAIVGFSLGVRRVRPPAGFPAAGGQPDASATCEPFLPAVLLPPAFSLQSLWMEGSLSIASGWKGTAGRELSMKTCALKLI